MTLRVREFTDPGCPFAFWAEPRRLRLRWLYGEEIDFEQRMVVLSCTPEDNERRGLTPERYTKGLRTVQRSSGMPIDARPRERVPVTMPACRAVVAARRRSREAGERVLRRLRVRGMGGQMIDEPATLEAAWSEAGLDPAALPSGPDDVELEAELHGDMDLARDPLPAARHLDGRLASWGEDEGRRYTCPSYVFSRSGNGREIAAPGFQPVEVYEVIVANLAAELPRRPDPDSVEEILAWADQPLSTEEVAAVGALGITEAREALARVATNEPVGSDGYWALPELSARRAAA